MESKNIYDVRDIDERWNFEMISIVRNSPIESSGLKIVFDRQPDILFLPKLRTQHVECAGFFIRNCLRGFAILMHKEAQVNGKLQTVLYFGNLYVDPSARGKGFFYRLSDLFFCDWPAHIDFGFAVIMQGNLAAKSLLNRFHKRYPHMPHSKVIGQWKVNNILMTFNLKINKTYTVRHAQMGDLDGVVKLLQKEYSKRLFSPKVTKEKILNDLKKLPNFGIENYYIAKKGHETVGVCCAWDMTSVKKNRILSYGKKFKWVSILYKIFTPLFNFPRLPTEGESFRDITITDYAVHERNPEILKALLLKIYKEYRAKKYHMLIFGCSANDPLSAAAKPFFSQSVISDILIFSKSKEFVDRFNTTEYPWIDMSLL